MALNLTHEFEPRGGCKRIFELKDPEILLSGPAGTGKSRACLEKLHLICLINPGVRGLIVRKTLASLGSTALVTWRNYVIKEALATGDVVYYGGSAQEAPQYRYSNGSSITIGGMDRPSRIMSSEYDIVYVQEATELTLEDIDMINTRLRNWQISFQQLIMDCNPAQHDHWLKLRADVGKTKLIETRHEDNPTLFDEIINDDESVSYVVTERGAAYIEKLNRLTGVRYKRLRLGLWVSAEGIVYEEYDPYYHLLEWNLDENGNKIPLPEEWSRYWVIDFGYSDPFVCQWWAIGDDGELYLYREIYMSQRTVEEHAKTILEQVTKIEEKRWFDHINGKEHVKEIQVWTEPRPMAIICDHDAENRKNLENKIGMGTQAAWKSISDGIDAVKERLKVNGEGYSRLYILDNILVEKDQNLVDELRPTCTKEEIGGYVWAKHKTDDRKKDEPVDKDNHGMDCMRYMVAFRDLHGKPRIREVPE